MNSTKLYLDAQNYHGIRAQLLQERSQLMRRLETIDTLIPLLDAKIERLNAQAKEAWDNEKRAIAGGITDGTE